MTGILTPRLRLRHWRVDHRDAFAAMHADPEVMADLGGPIGRADADAKFNHYVDTFLTTGHRAGPWKTPMTRFLVMQV